MIGRPFLVAGRERLAQVQETSAWSAEVQATAACPEKMRKAAAEFWTRVGLMEHASVAAFSRFSLQLMALGAPSDLLQKSHEAAADEIRHARDAFALASHYAGRPVGPGVLPMEGALADTIRSACGQARC